MLVIIAQGKEKIPAMPGFYIVFGHLNLGNLNLFRI